MHLAYADTAIMKSDSALGAKSDSAMGRIRFRPAGLVRIPSCAGSDFAVGKIGFRAGEDRISPRSSSTISNRDMKIMEERGGSAEAVTILAGGTWDRSNQHLTGYRSVQLSKLSVHFFERIDRS